MTSIKPRYTKQENIIKDLIKRKRLIKHSMKSNITQNHSTCVRCGRKKVEKMDNKNFGICPDCGAKIIFFIPSSWQMIPDSFKDKNDFIFFSCIGTGDTSGNAYRLFKKMVSIPGYAIIAVCPSKAQLEDTAQTELNKYFVDKNKGKERTDFVVQNKEKWVLKNGSTVFWLVADKPAKLKSYNVSAIWMVEAHGINENIYEELVNRVRESKTNEYKKDANGNFVTYIDHKGVERKILEKENALYLIESNIEESWVLKKAMRASKIYHTPSFILDNYDFGDRKNEVYDRVAFLASTKDSTIVDEDYFTKLASKKSIEAIKRELLGDIGADQEDIIKNWESAIKEIPLKILEECPKKVVFSYDFGGTQGYTVCLPGIFYYHNQRVKLHIMPCYYERSLDIHTHIQNIQVFRERFFNGTWIPNYRQDKFKLKLIGECGDKSGNRKNMQTMKTTFEIFKSYGIRLDPSKNPANSSITTINKLIYDESLTIDPTAINLIRELTTFKYVKTKDGEKKIPDDTRLKRRDAIDTLCYLLELIGYDPNIISFKKLKSSVMFYGPNGDRIF